MSGKFTIKDIAELAQTSKTTISFYLNGKYEKMSKETRKKIEKVIRETDYRPSIVARSLNSKSTKLIGVLIGDITNTFSNQIVKGIEEEAHKSGYQVMIGNSNYDQASEDKYIESMLMLGVDGFIIQPTSHFRKYSRIIEEKKKQMIFFDSQLYEHRTSWIKTNNYDAVYDTIQTCVEKGYQKFILITADTSRLSTRIERATGFMDALSDCKQDYVTLTIADEHVDVEEVKNFLAKEVSIQEKTLVFVPNCWALPLVFNIMKELNFTFPQIGLLGFDNTEWTNFSSPTISTIVQPAFEEGRQATKMLIDQIEGINRVERQQVLDCTVHWKESTF
ncbi:LacI family DNA-binding transcriptional regulator [Streptococcus ruminantium]|uniref:LacI family DNA-binding transcriptional regulator n=1 Tax=Streptococcus ruminantium TaxID=1917441 RepID=A0ABU1B3D2_9STRE|nr:LacI family DNA-binding transcriptional regulator [Streptococcus ruminantium]MDQ8758946.1 LacI family DNA-binding transcriptional regulator [Streptococcus ruminantium]MDQ8769575.1 LacI family DNA-binding transcriptional regulator [Streptococcus ruminantium]MDQ8774247.1 LacI family DNA-binding transcriptional regulator [Streptococcus ruminantium]MDQ8780213.1 LacI family DNA-binding transcriptional regulator [Streptococcus ruminantium]MDQ8794035.1 LacI family DNA-binding transcriptional regul